MSKFDPIENYGLSSLFFTTKLESCFIYLFVDFKKDKMAFIQAIII